MASGNLHSEARRTYKLKSARLFGNVPQPWRSGLPGIATINPVPSMICEDESRFLHWIARHYASGQGCIVDLGPLAGGSTHALCSGLALNPAATDRSRVHSFDLWRMFPGWDAYFPGEQLKCGDDLQPLFKRNLRAFADRVVEHPGDLRKYRWSGEPIEILFVDAAKAFELWAHMLLEFLPHCIPGRTLIVHQDWVCAECPWIHLTTARLSEHFVPVDSPDGGTVAFLLQHAIPRAALKERDFLTQPLPPAAERFGQAASWMTGWYALNVRLAEAHYLAMRGHGEEALAIVDRILAHPDFEPVVQYDVELVRAAVRRKAQEDASPPRWRGTGTRLVQRIGKAVGFKY